MIYVDNYNAPFRGMMMCHMMTDGDELELHTFAAKLGLKREWYQGDHYDISLGKKKLALQLGAVECSPLKMVELRRAKRHARQSL